MKTRTGGVVPITNWYDTCQLVQKWFLVCWAVTVFSESIESVRKYSKHFNTNLVNQQCMMLYW